VEEAHESRSIGADARGQKATVGWRRAKREIVLASELQDLPDLEGYLIMSAGGGAAKVKLDIYDRPKTQPHFLPKKDDDVI
jgi:type IV secretory pathway TraG/TraD family ATPase VirD4